MQLAQCAMLRDQAASGEDGSELDWDSVSRTRALRPEADRSGVPACRVRGE